MDDILKGEQPVIAAITEIELLVYDLTMLSRNLSDFSNINLLKSLIPGINK